MTMTVGRPKEPGGSLVLLINRIQSPSVRATRVQNGVKCARPSASRPTSPVAAPQAPGLPHKLLVC